jgi:hypothetical protein
MSKTKFYLELEEGHGWVFYGSWDGPTVFLTLEECREYALLIGSSYRIYKIEEETVEIFIKGDQK